MEEERERERERERDEMLEKSLLKSLIFFFSFSSSLFFHGDDQKSQNKEKMKPPLFFNYLCRFHHPSYLPLCCMVGDSHHSPTITAMSRKFREQNL